MSKNTTESKPAETSEAEKIIADAKAEAEKILEAARAEAEQIAKSNAPSPAPKKPKGPEEMVSVRLFKDNGRYKDDVFVAVNGRRFQIKRGVTVKLPKYVADVLEQSQIQDQATADMMERKASDFEAETKALGI